MTVAPGRNALGLGLSSSHSPARVWCGIEPTKRTRVSLLSDKDSSPFSKKSPTLITNSPADRRNQRQNASSVSTVICPPPTTRQVQDYGVGTLDRDVDTVAPSTEHAPAQSLAPATYIAEAACGLVECSGRGCRPLYAVPELQSRMDSEHAAQVVFHGAATETTDLRLSTTTTTPQSRAKVDNSAVKKAFDAALRAAPGDGQLLSEFAVFTWKALGDLDGAEELYNKALEVAPEDSNILASYALFLWQSDQ